MQCPVCMNSELELISKNHQGHYRCACGAEFTSGGNVIIAGREPTKKTASTK